MRNTLDSANQYCREKAATSGSSFYYSFLFLPPEQRQAITALYAFCRSVDDIVDECSDKNIAQQKLAWWQAEITRVFSNVPTHPIGQALCAAKDRFPLQQLLFEEILQGMNMDVAYQGYETFEDLRLYCHCVASAPGLLAAEIFTYQNPDTQDYAKNLGIAFQLVNIIRDVGEDAARGRIYIPEAELAQFSLSSKDIFSKQYSENFLALMQHQAARAREYYKTALQFLPASDRKAQSSGLIMAEIYFTLLKEIEKLQFQVLHQRVKLTPLRKLWIAWRTSRRIQCP